MLDSELLRMQGVVWRHPAAHKAWVEAEKKKAEEKKRIAAAKKSEAAREKEREKIIRKQLKETGRLNDLKDAEKRLATLHKEVAALELKAKGLSQDQIDDFELRQSVIKEAENRLKIAGVEADLTGAALLLKKEEAIAKRRKDETTAQSMIAAQRRRELLEYKHLHGLPASPTPFDLFRARNKGKSLRYPRPSQSNTAIYDDPKFWALSEEDQQLLEGLQWWEQQRLGFGPYDEDGAQASQLGEADWPGHEVDEEGRRVGEPLYVPGKIKGFCFSLAKTAPGWQILRVLGSLTASVPTLTPPARAQLTREERYHFDQEGLRDRAFAVSDLIEQTIEAGGNGLIEVTAQLVPLPDGYAEWYVEGHAVIVRQLAPRQQPGFGAGFGGGWGAGAEFEGGLDHFGELEALEKRGHNLPGAFGNPLGKGVGAGPRAWGGAAGLGGGGRVGMNGLPGDWPPDVGGLQQSQYPKVPFHAFQQRLARERLARDRALGGGDGYDFGGPSFKQGPLFPQYPHHKVQNAFAGSQALGDQSHPAEYSAATFAKHDDTPAKPRVVRFKEDRSLAGNHFPGQSPAAATAGDFGLSPLPRDDLQPHIPTNVGEMTEAEKLRSIAELEAELETNQKAQMAEKSSAEPVERVAALEREAAAPATKGGGWLSGWW